MPIYDQFGRLLVSGGLQDVIGAHLALPSLRGFWPMSAMNNPNVAASIIPSLAPARDLSVNVGFAGYALTSGLVPYVTLAAASSEYLYRVDDLSLRGANSFNGMTWGGWFKATSLPGNNLYMGLNGKWGGALVSDEYLITLFNNAGTQQIWAYVGNAVITPFVNVTQTLTLGAWYHIIGRWVPSVSLDLFINGVKVSNTTSIPAALTGNTGAFNIGAFGAANYLDGSATLQFVAGYALSDAHILQLYQLTAPLFP
jgi:hypothetical protein